MQKKTNILYIFTDQQYAGAMSCAGNPYLQTPAIDRIARQGVRFTNAYCSFPLCVPSRMSMATGRMPHELGIFANCPETEKPCEFPTMGNLFQEAGYRTKWIGKWHLTIPEADLNQHGFEEIILGGGYGKKDSRKTEETIKFLKSKPEEPFLLVLSYNNPHDCCEYSRGQELKMGEIPDPPAETALPPLPANHGIPENEPEALRKFARDNPRIFPSANWDELQARKYLWGYNRLVEMVDQEISQVLDTLEQTGLDENTLVIFSSDHGDGASHHRWNQKWTLYDESANVPLIFSYKGMARTGKTEDSIVSAGLDLLPTLCSYAGIQPPEGLPGKSLHPLIEGQNSFADRAYVVSELSLENWANVGEDKGVKIRMVRTKRYKYIAYNAGKPREQLIDMEKDPGEMFNLADSPEHQQEIEKHRQYLEEWCKKTGDCFYE